METTTTCSGSGSSDFDFGFGFGFGSFCCSVEVDFFVSAGARVFEDALTEGDFATEAFCFVADAVGLVSFFDGELTEADFGDPLRGEDFTEGEAFGVAAIFGEDAGEDVTAGFVAAAALAGALALGAAGLGDAAALDAAEAFATAATFGEAFGPDLIAVEEGVFFGPDAAEVALDAAGFGSSTIPKLLFTDLRKMVMTFSGSSDPKMEEPATITFAPAAAALSILSGASPPST
jgi:hypothetical protein